MILLFRFILLVLCFYFSNADCRPGEYKYNSRCFRFVNSPRTFDDSENYCKSIGYHLVSVHDAFENAYLQNISKYEFELSGSYFRIGLNTSDDITWQWTDSTIYNYWMWSPGQPPIGGDQCAAMIIADGKWRAYPCSRTLHFVCAGNASGPESTNSPQVTTVKVTTPNYIVPDINCMFIGDALYLGDPSTDTTKQATYTKQRDLIASVAAQLFNMTANSTINTFGGRSQFFGYSEGGFTFYDNTDPYFNYDIFLDDLTTNNYWDSDTDYNSGDVNGTIDKLNNLFGWSSSISPSSTCIVFFSGATDLNGVSKISSDIFKTQIGVGIDNTDFSSVVPNSIKISNSFTDADAAQVVNAILGAFL